VKRAVTERVLYLVRHGRTELNRAGVLRGRLDLPLDDVGTREAAAVAEVFAAVPLDAVVASPLARAHATAGMIAAGRSTAVAVDDALTDRDYGPWAGTARERVEALHGSVDAAPGVELREAFERRVVAAATAHAARHHRVLIVAHDAVNRALLAHLCADLPGPADALPQPTGCWNRLDARAGGWTASIVGAVPGDGRRP
jgi:broad specificity phosphatase PhoE